MRLRGLSGAGDELLLAAEYAPVATVRYSAPLQSGRCILPNSHARPSAMATAVKCCFSMVFRNALSKEPAVREALSTAWPWRSWAASDTSPACFLASRTARLKSVFGGSDISMLPGCERLSTFVSDFSAFLLPSWRLLLPSWRLLLISRHQDRGLWRSRTNRSSAARWLHPRHGMDGANTAKVAERQPFIRQEGIWPNQISRRTSTAAKSSQKGPPVALKRAISAD